MIAGAGFARMAWKLAQSRTYNCDQHDWVSEKWKLPFPREEHCGMPDIEYYRIIDNATVAEVNRSVIGVRITL